MPFSINIREAQLINEVAKEYFAAFNCDELIGDIDFAVAYKQRFFGKAQYLLWAEAKAGTKHDIDDSLVQLILTIGRAKTHTKRLPPKFLGAFDAEKMLFVNFYDIQPVFDSHDIDWTEAPNDHKSETFLKLKTLVVALKPTYYRFRYGSELKTFIKDNFADTEFVSQITITKNNFVAIYHDWREKVMPGIVMNWDVVKDQGILDADFYLADVLSENNDGTGIMENLRVILHNDHYVFDRVLNTGGFFDEHKAIFKPNGLQAHQTFWNIYKRPPKKEFWDYIVARRDLLVPQDIRERKGSFFTPQIWARKSKEYLARVLGDNWQQEYYIWDCCAGTGNLLYELTEPARIWASTLDKADVDVMKQLSQQHKNNLLQGNIFEFDFLNDDFTKVPSVLQDILKDPDKRKKLIIYINPPYAEASSTTAMQKGRKNKPGVTNETKIFERYKDTIGGDAGREVFALFMIRIYKEIPDCILATFSTIKVLLSQNFVPFRTVFQAQLKNLFLVPAYTFDNVQGKFPIGFFIWNLAQKEEFKHIQADVYDERGDECVPKNLNAPIANRFIIQWLKQFYDKKNDPIGFLRMLGVDMQNNSRIFFTSKLTANDLKVHTYTPITPNNVIYLCVYLAVRQCIKHTWLNNQDQFLYPQNGWQRDADFLSDCLAYTLFHGKNRIQSGQGVNHWIPFVETAVNAPATFQSHFMSDLIRTGWTGTSTLFTSQQSPTPIAFTPQAQAVMDAGKAIWTYYLQQPDANVNASFYDIKLYFQGETNGRMNPRSEDEHYTNLLAMLRAAQNVLAQQIARSVYKYGFLI